LGHLLVPFLFIPRGEKFEPVLQKAFMERQMTTELHTALDDKVGKFAHLFEDALVVIAVALMVFKPF
jgi:hypothetical protein